MIDYSKILSKTVVDIKPSGIRKFFDIANTMDDVISLGVGEPDFRTPWQIRSAGIRALESGKTRYTSNRGLEEFRAEISRYVKRKYNLAYSPEKEILVTVGGSEAIDIALRSVIEAGDEVIVPTPSFVCYAPLVAIAGGTPVILETKFEDKFKIDPEALKAAITPRTKMLVLPYPNNPTGAIMTREELAGIAEVLKDTNILVLSDEIYAEMTYTGNHCSIASLEGMWERTIIASGFSKAYAMTGWRLGYLCAPKAICEQMLKIHQYGIMSSPTTAQFAAIEALRNGDEDIRMMVDEYNRRRRYIYNGLKSIGIESFEPEGAFYIFPKIGDYGLSGEEFCNRLLYEHKCAIVPGNAFGKSGEGFARISYAYSIKHITQALERIEAFVKTL
jgi:aminotransferase